MKKLKTIFMILAMTLVLFACKRADVKAATDNGVSVNGGDNFGEGYVFRK